MTYKQFCDKYNGRGIDFDGAYGFQCMDLAHQYATEVVGHDFAPAPAAKDVWNQNIEGYDKIANTPTGVPSQGDIIIWGTGVGAYGHIAVFDHGDSNTFTSFDQNWPLNSLCHFQPHNYNGVLGWFHPHTQVALQPTNTNDKAAVEFDRVIDYLHSVSIDPSGRREDNLEDYHVANLIKSYHDGMEARVAQPEQSNAPTATTTPSTPIVVSPTTSTNTNSTILSLLKKLFNL